MAWAILTLRHTFTAVTTMRSVMMKSVSRWNSQISQHFFLAKKKHFRTIKNKTKTKIYSKCMTVKDSWQADKAKNLAKKNILEQSKTKQKQKSTVQVRLVLVFQMHDSQGQLTTQKTDWPDYFELTKFIKILSRRFCWPAVASTASMATLDFQHRNFTVRECSILVIKPCLPKLRR